MRVAILGPYPVDGEINNVNGGVQAVIANMARGLSMFKGLDIHIITASGRITKDMASFSKGIHVHGVPFDIKLGNMTFYLQTRKRLCKKIKDIKPDLIHSHMFGYYTLAAIDSGYEKTVVSTHGISNAIWGGKAGILESIRYRLQHCVYMRCLKGSKNIIVNSPYARGSLSGAGKANVYDLDNPVSDIFFSEDNSMEEENRVLFAGNICGAKGIMTALYSLNILKDSLNRITLRLAGPVTDNNFYNKALRYIKKNNLQGYVNFLGHLDDSELKKEYERSSVFIFPSYQDVAPLALLQAMAAGKAIVASNIGGIPYIIDDGVNGFLINTGDPHSLAAKIILFMKDKPLRKAFGIKAHKKAFENNRIDIVAGKLYRIYNEVMDIC
ncbi:MAG: hypothetical protein COW10_07450 [Candidatus Omnitrophica bacterium CG12_big_fil_rev_8_21_14_0_65_42_8]|nr:MAG: hypothetical protein COW10_07450 [Candidatus Omnitrophica bacterium CG12_big_fil_rev_8_21_14_0_65_42_8]